MSLNVSLNVFCRVLRTKPWTGRLSSKQLSFVAGPDVLEKIRECPQTRFALSIIGWSDTEILEEERTRNDFRVIVFESDEITDADTATLDFVLSKLQSFQESGFTTVPPWSSDSPINARCIEMLWELAKSGVLLSKDIDPSLSSEGGVEAFVKGERSGHQLLYDMLWCNELYSGDGYSYDAGGNRLCKEYLIGSELTQKYTFFDLTWS